MAEKYVKLEDEKPKTEEVPAQSTTVDGKRNPSSPLFIFSQIWQI